MIKQIAPLLYFQQIVTLTLAIDEAYVVFLSPLQQIVGYYNQLGHDCYHILRLPFSLIALPEVTSSSQRFGACYTKIRIKR
jgi:hypothetical protein